MEFPKLTDYNRANWAIGKGGKVVTDAGTTHVSRLRCRAACARSNSVTHFGPTRRRTDLLFHPMQVEFVEPEVVVGLVDD